MHRTRVKICGLTREEDVRAAADLGADAVGFVCFAQSPRYVEPGRLAALARAVPPFVTPVLLFVDAGREQILAGLAAVPHALLQFHGSESPEFCGSLGRPYLRAVAVSAGPDLLNCEAQFPDAAALLADTPAQVPAAGGTAVYGGAGRTFPWERLPAQPLRRLPLILAGGLRADNVAAAIGAVRPFAVDVSSGVESARGIKSAERMREFLAAVRAADARAAADPDPFQGGAA
jgi:phosphoribosylanthranilate isomerase